MRPLNRVTSKLGAADFKTYQIVAPRKTHYRPATCEEVGCEPFAQGWRTVLDMATQPDLVATVLTCGRPYRKLIDGTTVTFIFEPGVACFQASTHVIALEREPLYLVKGGDWRGNPRRIETYRHDRASTWVDDFATHQQGIADAIEKG